MYELFISFNFQFLTSGSATSHHGGYLQYSIYSFRSTKSKAEKARMGEATICNVYVFNGPFIILFGYWR